MDRCIEALKDVVVFWTLSAMWCYRQMQVAEKDEGKITFTSHACTYKLSKMLFNAMSAPAMFQRAVDTILKSIQ